MAEYVKKRGKVIVINPEKDKTMVQVPIVFFPLMSSYYISSTIFLSEAWDIDNY